MQFVFIIGAARSGTKFLRSCLSNSDNVYQIPYDVSYIWRYRNENISHDELQISDISPKIKKYIEKQLIRLSGVKKNDTHAIILEKSVPNCLRVDVLYHIFPDAKFIHLIRNGEAVIESSIRQWTTPSDISYLIKKLRYFPVSNWRYALWFIKNNFFQKKEKSIPIWGPRYKGITEDIKKIPLLDVCSKQWKNCVEKSLKDLSEINKENFYEIRFEKLMQSSEVLVELSTFLGIKDIEKVIQYYDKNVIKDNNKKSLDNLSEQNRTTIKNYIGELMEELNYG